MLAPLALLHFALLAHRRTLARAGPQTAPLDLASDRGMAPTSDQRRQQTQAALYAVHNRRTRLPSIDFTSYTNEEGVTHNTKTRIVRDVQAPAFQKPTDDQFYSDETRTKPNVAFLKNHFYREGRLTDEQVRPEIHSRVAVASRARSRREVARRGGGALVSADSLCALVCCFEHSRRPSSSSKRRPSSCAKSPTCSRSMLPSQVRLVAFRCHSSCALSCAAVRLRLTVANARSVWRHPWAVCACFRLDRRALAGLADLASLALACNSST